MAEEVVEGLVLIQSILSEPDSQEEDIEDSYEVANDVVEIDAEDKEGDI